MGFGRRDLEMRAFAQQTRQHPGTSPSSVQRSPVRRAAQQVRSQEAGVFHDFGRISIFPEPRAAAAITVGNFADQSEHEADRTSEQVMNMIPPQPRTGGAALGEMAQIPEPSSVHELLGTPGRPLAPACRAFLEPRFGHDFSSVRIHDDRAADKAATMLSARAFTVGRQIAFGRGQYQPDTPSGMKLLAHELAHVEQQARDPAPVLRRAPALKGHSTNDLVDYRIAPAIDKALADSTTITRYVPAAKLKQEQGNLDVQDPDTFAASFAAYGKSDENVDEVPGFTNRKAKTPIVLRSQGKNKQGQIVSGATVEVALHEAIHFNSSEIFQANWGHNYNEGVTERFTEDVLAEQLLPPGRAYRDNLMLADGLIAALGQSGEDQIGQAYFKGDTTLWQRIVNSNRKEDIETWRKAAAKDPPDWNQANKLLTALLGNAGSTHPAAPPRAGSGSGSGAKTPAM